MTGLATGFEWLCAGVRRKDDRQSNKQHTANPESVQAHRRHLGQRKGRDHTEKYAWMPLPNDNLDDLATATGLSIRARSPLSAMTSRQPSMGSVALSA